jgi:hypothetical protein
MHRLPGVTLLALLSACNGEPAPYFPLEPGRSWQYSLTLDVIKDTPPQRVVVHNLGRSERDGEAVYLQRTQMSALGVYRIGADGIQRIDTLERDDSGTKGTLILPAPLSPGRSWRATSRLRLIESRTFAREDKLYSRHLELPLDYRIVGFDDSVTTPAGRFRNCLLVEASGQRTVTVDRGNNVAVVQVKHNDWYAPGVGLVRSERIETSDSPFLEPGRYLLELQYYDD